MPKALSAETMGCGMLGTLLRSWGDVTAPLGAAWSPSTGGPALQALLAEDPTAALPG